MKQCTKCGAPLLEEARVCPQCGAVQGQTVPREVPEERWPKISSVSRVQEEERRARDAAASSEGKEKKGEKKAPPQRTQTRMPWQDPKLLRVLVLAVLAVILLFAVVHLSKRRMEKPSSAVEPASPEVEEKAREEEESAPLLSEADEEIAQLMTEYFQAFDSRDVEKVRSMLDELPSDKEPAILDVSFDHYRVEKVYVQEGLREHDRVVLVTYTYQCAGVDTPIPAYSCLYLVRNEEGSWKIMSGAASDEGVEAFVETLRQEEEIRDVLSEVRSAYEDTLAAHPELIEKIGDTSFSAALVSAQAGERLRALTNVNVRATPDTHGELLGALDEGSIVTKEGREGEWIIIRYQGRDAYVYGEFFEVAQ